MQLSLKYLILIFIKLFKKKNCGSCYANAAISMLEARFNYKYLSLIRKYFTEVKLNLI